MSSAYRPRPPGCGDLRGGVALPAICVLLLGLLLGIPGPGAARAATMTWSAPQPVGRPSMPSEVAALDGLSCPSLGLCVGVAAHGLVVTSTDPASAGSWSSSRIDGGRPLVADACPTTSLCVALGEDGEILGSTDPAAAAWGAPTTAFPSVGLGLGGVACASVSLCVAVDGQSQIATSTDPAAGAWSVSDLPAEDQLDSVSCPTTTLCVIGDFDGSVLTSTDPAGGGGTYTASNLSSDVNSPDTMFGLLSVSCASDTECVAGDDNGDLLVTHDPTGGASAWTAAHLDRTYSLRTVTCTADGFCLAADNAGNVFTSPSPSPGGSAPAWTVTRDVDPTGFDVAACVPSGPCLLGADDGSVARLAQPTSGAPLAASFTPTLGAGPLRHPALTAISCPSRACVALDGAGDVLSTTRLAGPAPRWTGHLVNPGLGAAAALGCAADGFCAAVGPDGHIATGRARSSHWTLTNLNVTSLDLDGETESDELVAVSCPSRRLCVSVRSSDSVSANGELEVSHDPDAPDPRWQFISMGAADGYDFFTSVACPSSRLCIAGDGQGDRIAVSTTGGRTWHFHTVAHGPGISDVACPSASFCALTDRAGVVITSEHPAGTRHVWHAARVDRHELVAIACASRARCAAFDGRGRVLTSATPAAGAGSWTATNLGRGLTGVACPSDRLCLLTTRGGAVRVGRA